MLSEQIPSALLVDAADAVAARVTALLHDAEVESAVFELGDLLTAIAFEELDAGVRMLGEEVLDRRQQQSRRELRPDPDGEPPFVPSRELLQSRSGAVGARHGLTGEWEERPSALGQPHRPSWSTDEKAYAGRDLELADSRGQRRLGDPQTFRRAAEVPFVRDREEISELPDIHPSEGRP